MPEKVNLYAWVRKGINLVTSPIHLDDNEVTEARNVVLDRDARDGSVRKRPGLVKVNSSALAGSVTSIIPVPLASTTDVTKTLFAAINDGTGNNWRTTTDGSSWSNNTTIDKAHQIAKIPGHQSLLFSSHGHVATLRGKLYYPDDTYTQYPLSSPTSPPLRVFDGTTDQQVVLMPRNISAGTDTYEEWISTMVAFEDKLYIATGGQNSGATSDYFKIQQYNPETGFMLQVGPSVNVASLGGILTIVGFEGKIWVANNQNQGLVYSIRPPDGRFPGDTAWVTEKDFGSSLAVASLASYKGNLYAGLNGVTPAIHVRSSTDGTWSQSEASPFGAGASGGYYSALFVYEEELYATVFHNHGTPRLVVRKFDNSSWSQAYDIEGSQTGAKNIGQPILYKSNMYLVVADNGSSTAVTLKNTSGTWSEVDTSVGLRGFMGVVEVTA